MQRSSVQIVDNMHKLLDLEVDGIPTLTGNSQGLVAWWTFEDGAGKVSVTDVTGHRFKTLIERRQAAVCGTTAASAAVGIVKGTSTVPITATAVSSKNKLEESRVGAAGAAATNRASSPALGKQRPAVESEMEGFFTHEEAARAGLPEEVRHMLPAPFLRCLPVHATGCNAVAAAGAGVAGGGATSTGMDITGERKSINSSSPWEVWLGTMPKWSWLDAETLPTPKALNMPSTVATTEKARSAIKGPPQLPKSPTPGKNSEGPAEQQEHHHPIPPASAVDSKDPINGISSTTSATERPVRGLLPVPSLRARGVCPYELRRHRLATSGRELQREVDCPLGILHALLKSEFTECY